MNLSYQNVGDYVESENTDEVLNKIYIVLDETSLGPTLAVIQHFYCSKIPF